MSCASDYINWRRGWDTVWMTVDYRKQ